MTMVLIKGKNQQRRVRHSEYHQMGSAVLWGMRSSSVIQELVSTWTLALPKWNGIRPCRYT